MDPQLDDEETRVGLRYILRQGLAGHAMGTLAGGVFMVEIALSLGASLFVIGPLAALPSLAQLAQLPATHLVERYRDRKRIAFLGLGGVRVCIFSIATIPLAVPTVVGPGGGLGLLLGLVALQGVFSAAGGTAYLAANGLVGAVAAGLSPPAAAVAVPSPSSSKCISKPARFSSARRSGVGITPTTDSGPPPGRPRRQTAGRSRVTRTRKHRRDVF